ncbi:MAG TPA: cytochrome b N-terminal domain-containing protein [Terriglobales bacterium]|nr:cytochrome b N-terminal domain-containing protein [Terriglobales bacterium]
MPKVQDITSGALRNLVKALGRWKHEAKQILSDRVFESKLGFRVTWYLGALTLGTFAIQIVTGLLLMLYYHPSIPQGYADMKDLQFVVSSGLFLRNLHRWSAHAMVLLVFAHMAKVFYRGAFRTPRELNWVVGVCMLLLTLLLSYTGYLLPWDQLSYWGTTVGANIMSAIPVAGDRLRFVLLGGHTVNANALLRFYVLHTTILPLTVILLVTIHLWRLHKDGGMYESRELAGTALPARREQEKTISYRELLFREIIAIELLAAILGVMALRWNAPLEQLADSLHTPNPAKAPWYFTGLQELLHYFPPLVAGIFFPALVVTALIVVPFFGTGKEESFWIHQRSKHILLAVAAIGVVSVLLISRHAWDALLPVWIIAVFMGLAAASAQAPAGRFRVWLSSKPVSFWIMTWLLLEGLVLTSVGTFFRGPGWSWVWPWAGGHN